LSGIQSLTSRISLKVSDYSNSRKTPRQLFDQQEPREQRRLLNFVVSNCSWKDGHLTVRYRQPFDFLVDTAENAQGLAAAEGPESAKTEIWLGGRDSNPACLDSVTS
jgi:hypothetical protein